MTDVHSTEPEGGTVPAGDFGSWLADMQAALRGDRDSDVPCDGCTACCRASHFIHIAPGESETLAQIPSALLFQAPGRPKGHVLLGYDERGHCPMLIDDRCSIYEHRPQTCRTYDCRIFPATGVDVAVEGRHEVAERAGRWRFSYPSDADRVQHAAALAAATYLDAHRGELPAGGVPAAPTQLAVLAVEMHDAFLDDGGAVAAEPRVDAVSVVLLRRRRPAG